MKRILLLFLLLASMVPVMAQRHGHRLRPWSQGPLRYDDFRGRPTAEADGSFADFSFGYRRVLDTVGCIAVPHNEAWGVMRTYGSWMLPGSRNATRLRYHQLQFDLVERARQELQRGLTAAYYTPQSLFENADIRLAERMHLLDSLTLFGTDSAAMARWQPFADSAFGVFAPDTHTLAPLRQGWAGEFHFFAGRRSFRGELDNCFKPGIDLAILFSALYRHHVFSLDVGFGFASLRDSVFANGSYFYPDSLVTDLRVLAEYGFRLVDCRRWSLTPFVAGGLHLIDQSEEDDPFYVGTGTFGCGLLLQWRSFMNFEDISDGGVGRSDFDFAARLTVIRSTFSGIVGRPAGWGVYLQLGVGFGYGTYRRR